MKKKMRYLSCLLALFLLLSFINSCHPSKAGMDDLDAFVTTFEQQAEEKQTAYEAFGRKYTLTDADRESLSKLLEDTLALMQNNAEEAVIDEKVGQIEDHFYHIADQADLAYVLFCMNQENQTALDNYLHASEMKNDIFYDYMVMCQKVDASSYAYRSRFFEDWSENDFLQMRQYTEKVNSIKKANDAILVEYRALDSESESFDEDFCRLYLEMVGNNQDLAEMFGFPDYAAYSYEVVYERDYSREELAVLREYVQTYIVPLYMRAYNAFFNAYEMLGIADKLLFSGWLQSDYHTIGKDPVNAYFSSLPTTMKEGMTKLLRDENSVFTSDKNAYAGAFTGYFYEDSYPFCYFGPGYHSVFTVIHEAGHFYAADCQCGLDIDLDLAELHSQGNEWLMLAYSKKLLSPAIYKALRAYKVYETLATIVIGVMIDEFEEQVYTNVDSLDGSVEQFEGFMSEISKRYGGERMIKEYITDISSYWKRVVIESPVYYISYAISAVSAMALYDIALKDYAKALEIYQAFTEEELIEDAFLENLKKAGLATPFEEDAYVAIYNIAVH